MSEYSAEYDSFTVRVDKVGGGTLWRRYDGDWIVKLWQHGEIKETKLIFTGTPKTHMEVTKIAAEIWSLSGDL